MSPRPQIDHIRKPQLLEAAADVIAERGLAATRVADVAERVGASPAAVLYWFGSKDELLAKALTVEEDRFYGAISERLAAVERPSERLRTLIEACAADYDWTLWIELWTRALRDPGVFEARRRLDRRWREEIAAVVRAGQDAGEFAQGDADLAATILASLLDGLAVQVVLDDPVVTGARMRQLALHAAELILGCELSQDAATERRRDAVEVAR